MAGSAQERREAWTSVGFEGRRCTCCCAGKGACTCHRHMLCCSRAGLSVLEAPGTVLSCLLLCSCLGQTHKTTIKLTMARKKSTMMLTLHGLRFCTTAPAGPWGRTAATTPRRREGQQLAGAACGCAVGPRLRTVADVHHAAVPREVACAPAQGRGVSAAVLLPLPGPAEPGLLPLQLHGWEQGTHTHDATETRPFFGCWSFRRSFSVVPSGPVSLSDGTPTL